MYRLPVMMLCAVLIAGCSHLANSSFLSGVGDKLYGGKETPPATAGEQELQRLFEQPYIDPLTEYLQRHENDAARAAQLRQVRAERERRCAQVAHRYNTDEITETGLALYRRGYSFSCPEDVAAYEARLAALQDNTEPTQSQSPTRAEDINTDSPEPEPGDSTPAGVAETSSDSTPNVSVSRQLNECYLLTRIRNYSGALEACRGPAEDGIAGAQLNLARIHKTLGQYESAYTWARKAAAESGEAACLLGELYAGGLGVEEDHSAAAKWFRTAIELGDTEAEAALERLVSASGDAHER